MRVIVSNLMNATGSRTEIKWPNTWPIPREGDSIVLNPDDPDVDCIREVVWYPEGEEGESSAPFVYIAVGPRRPKHF